MSPTLQKDLTMSFSRTAIGGSLLALGLCLTGCQSLMLGEGAGKGHIDQLASASAAKPGMYSIEYHPVDGMPERAEVPLKDATYVQQAIEQNGVLKRFRREKIQLYRKNESNNTYSRMEIEFDRGKHRVPPESDYAIRPGDRLVVREDTSTMIDDLFSKVNKGPLSAVLH
jgi:hypothetical protein